jgi:hypothetical protein
MVSQDLIGDFYGVNTKLDPFKDEQSITCYNFDVDIGNNLNLLLPNISNPK